MAFNFTVGASNPYGTAAPAPLYGAPVPAPIAPPPSPDHLIISIAKKFSLSVLSKAAADAVLASGHPPFYYADATTPEMLMLARSVGRHIPLLIMTPTEDGTSTVFTVRALQEYGYTGPDRLLAHIIFKNLYPGVIPGATAIYFRPSTTVPNAFVCMIPADPSKGRGPVSLLLTIIQAGIGTPYTEAGIVFAPAPAPAPPAPVAAGGAGAVAPAPAPAVIAPRGRITDKPKYVIAFDYDLTLSTIHTGGIASSPIYPTPPYRDIIPYETLLKDDSIVDDVLQRLVSIATTDRTTKVVIVTRSGGKYFAPYLWSRLNRIGQGDIKIGSNEVGATQYPDKLPTRFNDGDIVVISGFINDTKMDDPDNFKYRTDDWGAIKRVALGNYIASIGVLPSNTVFIDDTPANTGAMRALLPSENVFDADTRDPVGNVMKVVTRLNQIKYSARGGTRSRHRTRHYRKPQKKTCRNK